MARTLFLLAATFFMGVVSQASAEELNIVFTGQSYAALYPCDCRVEPDGGVVRRAGLIRDIRQQLKNVIVLEAGASLASGPEDENSQDEDLDKKRSLIYLEALALMKYDAVLLDGQSFAFGEEFIRPYQGRLPFVCANISGPALPYILKDFGAFQVAVVGLTEEAAVQKGARDWRDPARVLPRQIAELKKKGADVIILLSALSREDDERLLRRVKGIDIVINGAKNLGSVTPRDVNGVVYLQTWWQARRVGVLNIELSGGKIGRVDVSVPPLVAGIPEDPAVAALLPACFRDEDCRRMPGLAAGCREGGSDQARCTYVSLPRVTLTVIGAAACRTCHTDLVIRDLKDIWGDLNVIDLDEKDPAAQKLIKNFQIRMLPAYFFHQNAEKSEAFKTFRPHLLEAKDGYYRIKPEIAGVSYLVARKKTPGTIDIFYDYRYPFLRPLWELLSSFGRQHPDITIAWHFLSVFDPQKGFMNLGAPGDIEEFKRVACAVKYYPEGILDYLLCRSGQVDAGYWDECAIKAKMDPAKIKACAMSEEGTGLLKERIAMTEELEIATGPTFIIDNVEIFGIVNVPTLEEFEATVLEKEKPRSAGVK
jgi:hypothetical protein